MFDFLKSPGKISINTDKQSYTQGDSISAKAILKMDKAAKAKALRVGLFAERRVPYRTSKGGRGTRTQTVYSYDMDLAGEQTYSGTKEYEFSLKVPQHNEMKLPEGTLGQVAEVAINIGRLTGSMVGPTKWYIKAWLDIEKKKDVSEKLQIQVG